MAKLNNAEKKALAKKISRQITENREKSRKQFIKDKLPGIFAKVSQYGWYKNARQAVMMSGLASVTIKENPIIGNNRQGYGYCKDLNVTSPQDLEDKVKLCIVRKDFSSKHKHLRDDDIIDEMTLMGITSKDYEQMVKDLVAKLS